jgi:hypothetical protein
MRKLLLVALAGIGLASSASGVTIGGATGVQETQSFTIDFNGIVEGSVVSGLTSQITFTVVDIDATTDRIVLNYSILNNSSSPITASRVSAFGFNADPNLSQSGTTVTGLFTQEHFNLNVPQLGVLEFCGNNNAGNSCGGGGSSGVTKGNTGGGTLTLAFVSDIANGATLSDFFVRYQSINGATCRDRDGNLTTTGCSGVGVATPPIPEPTSAAVFGLGALIVGAALRRRLSA